MADKNIVAVLKLDSKDFQKNISDTEKNVLKFSAAVTGAGAAILAAVKISANWQDSMIKTSRLAGVASETFSSYAYAAGLSGVNTELMAKSFTILNNVTPDISKKLAAFGVNVKDTTGKLKDSETIMGDIADQMAAMKSPADRAKLAFAAFGEEGGKMVNLLSGGRAGLKAAADEAERFGLVVSTKAGQNAEQFNDSISRVGLSVKGFTATLSETVIEMINSSGIMQTVSDAIAAMTTAWKGLDEDTRKTIVTVVGIITAGAALAGVLIGIKAALAVVAAAFSPVILATVAIAAAFAVLVYSVVKYWDQLQDIFKPVQVYFAGIITRLKSFAEGVKNLFAKFLPEITSTGKEIDKFGTTMKGIMAGLSIGAVVIGNSFSVLGEIVVGIVKTVGEVAQVVSSLITGEFDAAVTHAAAASEEITKTMDNVGNTFKESYKAINDILSQDMTVKVDTTKIKKTKKDIDDIKPSIDSLAQAFTPVANELVTAWERVTAANREFADKADATHQVLIAQVQFGQKVAGVLGQVASQISKLADIAAAKIQRTQQILDQNLDSFGRAYDKFFSDQLAAVTKTEDARIEKLSSYYDAELTALKQQEARKNAAILTASQERKLLLDEEYQNAKAAKEAEFQAYLASEMQKYEAHKAFLLAQVVDKEQAQLVETELQQGLLEYLAQLQQQHDEQMSNFAVEYNAKQKAEDDRAKEEIKVSQENANKTVAQLEQEKNSALAKAEEAKQRRLARLEEENNRRKELMDKARAFKQYQTELAIYNTTKYAKVAEIMVNTASASMGAIAGMAGIPIVGIPLGIAMAGLVAAAGAAAISQVMSSPPIPPPLLAKGGWAGGNYSHDVGGMNANLESNEFTIDKYRSQRMYAAVDSIIEGAGNRNGGGIVINFYEGSIRSSNISSEDEARKMAEMMGQELRRMGIVA